MRPAWIGVAALSVTIATCPRQAWAGERDELLNGVNHIAGPGTPGALALLSPAGQAVVVGRVDGQLTAPVVASGTLDKGRVVAFGHSGYFGAAGEGDTARLIENAMTWVSRGRPMNTLRIGSGSAEAAAFLKSRGYLNVVALPKAWDVGAGFEVIVLGSDDVREADIQPLQTWLRAGGGVIAMQTGWGWQQLNNDADIRGNALNRLLRPAGLGWTDETIDETGPEGRGGEGFATSVAPLEPAELTGALKALEAGGKRDAAVKTRLAQAGLTAMRGVRLLPADDTVVLPRLRKLMLDRAEELVVGPDAPMRESDALLRFLLAVQVQQLGEDGPERVAAHPAAKLFPGEVAEGAARVKREVVINTGTPGWHSTGLYAAAGDVVRVTVGASDGAETNKSGRVGKRGKGLSVRIGCHTDRLWHHSTWRRVPEVSLRRELGEGTTAVASAFGGLVYIDVPAGMAAGGVPVKVEGAVESPLFTLGKTTADEWKRIRNAPGPWAELATGKVIVSVPSAAVRGLDDPTEVLRTWDRVLDAAADLATIPRERERPERYVADVQISAGYMHSGYPIMTHLDAADEMTVASKLAGGAWGLFHELGHNHQQPAWTFDGTGEVTCNLFSLYIMETVCGKRVSEGHEAVNDAAKRRERARRHIESGADFAAWKRDPFLALEMYIQLREAFGWEAYKKVFAEYRGLAPGERPRGEQQERDEWMKRFSRAAGRDLGPFFARWGVPVSPEARAAVAGLPAWMPDGMPEATADRKQP